jgi:hypothetical protein
MKSSFNREQAKLCRRLAISLTDQVEKSRLLRLAEKYEAKADAEDKKSITRLKAFYKNWSNTALRRFWS